MDKVAIVFPGQASQYVGMGKDLYNADRDVRDLYALASDEIGEDIGRLSFDGPAETLTQTRFTQPAILLHSLAVLIVLKENVPKAALTAGHSLGEYGSLALAGVLSFEDAVRAVVRRSSLMEKACRENPGTMAAIIGLEDEKIAEACSKASAKGVVVPANFNSANQVVISGAVEAIEEACRLCTEMGAKKAMILQVGGAFHSPLMKPAGEGMREYLNTVEFKEPATGIVPNVTAEAEHDPLRLKGLLIDQLTSPVRWHQTMKCLAEAGVDTVIEAGPGKVLAGLARRELKGARIFNLDTMEDVEKFSTVVAG